MLAKSNVNGIDTLISQTLIDIDISHEELTTILKEKDRYEMVKDSLTLFPRYFGPNSHQGGGVKITPLPPPAT